MDVGAEGCRAAESRGPCGQPKLNAAVLLGLYRPIADIQQRLRVPWERPEPTVAVLLELYRPNADSQWGIEGENAIWAVNAQD